MATTQQLTVTATHSDGSTEDVTAEATYSSADESVATVSAAGLITAQAVGNTTVTATYSGKSADCAVSVTNPVEGLAVAPTSTELELG